MKLSHSKLACILNCPMTYYLSYVCGISKKIEKPALAIGSAVHWGIEHNTEDLTDYFAKNGTCRSRDSYGRDQLLAEAMVHGYLKHKDEIFEKLLTYNDEKLELVDESHELYVTGKLNSSLKTIDHHDFVGIIDLLLLTNKGFVLIDYKTSSFEPDWNNYLDQIYRYIFMLKSEFPDIPVVKIGIVNIRKTGIRQKKNENNEEFFRRMKFEYDINDENYVNYHEYNPDDLNKDLIENYIQNLTVMADTAQTIVDNNLYYINYSAAIGQYGRSDYYDIFYKTPDAHVLYKISDHIYDEESNNIVESRDCVPIDMLMIEDCGFGKIVNKYERFKSLCNDFIVCHNFNVSTMLVCDFLDGDNFIYDYGLIERYLQTYLFERSKD